MFSFVRSFPVGYIFTTRQIMTRGWLINGSTVFVVVVFVLRGNWTFVKGGGRLVVDGEKLLHWLPRHFLAAAARSLLYKFSIHRFTGFHTCSRTHKIRNLFFFFWMVESNADSKFYRFFHSIKSNEDRKTKNYVCYSAFMNLACYLQKFKLIIYSNGFFSYSFIQLTNFFSFLFNRNNIYIWYVCVVCGMYLFAINS